MKFVLNALCLLLLIATISCNQKTTTTTQGAATMDTIYTVILLGPPLAGKGTVAARLSSDAQLCHLSTGNMFREHITKNTPLGIKAKHYIDAGNLVPDDVTIDMVFAAISTRPQGNGYLLDGFPRTIAQAEAFHQKLIDPSKIIVILIDVADDILVERSANRLTCSKCGQTYSPAMPPEKEGICDVCSGALIRRPDDAPEVTRERLKIYHEQTQPLIDFYAEKGVLKTVNGNASPDTVYERVFSFTSKKMGL